VFSFLGFPEQSDFHLLLPHDGDATGAAWRFAATLRLCDQPAQLPSWFQCSQSGCLPLSGPDALPGVGVDQPAEAAYRYRLTYQSHPTPAVVVQAWRRLPGGQGWMLRCGPMPLALFIRRFLPGVSV
jgi:hypothetical protein